jgi:predicted permease
MNWVSWFNRKRWERRMNAELQFHLDSLIEDYIRQGRNREEAIQRARSQFGSFELAKEECREQRPLHWVDHLRRDLIYAFRSLRRAPVLTLAVILTVALAIGANTAIFSVFEGAILQPLPYANPDQLAVLMLYNRNLNHPTYLSYPDFLDWRQSARSFQQIAAVQTIKNFDLTNPGTPEHLEGLEVSSNFFSTLGEDLQLGRALSGEEDVAGGAASVVISDRLWRDRFSASPAVLGKTITLDAVDYSIVGVLPAGFYFNGLRADVYTSIARDTLLDRGDRTIHNILCIGRLNPGISVQQALADLKIVQQRIDELHPDTERGQSALVQPLKEFVVGNIGHTVGLLMGAVGLLLLIACANIANLLLARSTVRIREFAIRSALGASKPQIIRLLIVESLLLSVAGGVLGLALAKWGLPALLMLAPGGVPRAEDISVNTAVMLFALIISTAVGITFGFIPALPMSRLDLQRRLNRSGRNTTNQSQAPRRVLVVLQVALTLVLLVGASLLLRTIFNLSSVNPGFDPQNVVTFQVGLSPSVSSSPSKVRNIYRELVDRISALPGVQKAEITGLVPFGNNSNEGPFWFRSHPAVSMAELPRAIYYPIGPDYFATMKIPLLRGRPLTHADTLDSERVVVIDDRMARTYFRDGDPIGQPLTMPHWGAASNVDFRIVGVVGHAEQYGLDGVLGNKPQIYFSVYQLPDDGIMIFRGLLTFAVRTPQGIATLKPAITNAVHKSGSDEPVYNFRTMQDVVTGSMGRQRFATILLGAFASLGLVLACVGTYGMIAYSTAQRANEIGIRVALGAKSSSILWLVIKQGLALAFTGIMIGAFAVLILARALSSFSDLLYGVRASDPATIGAVSLLLVTTTLVASYVPARRAARTDPLVSLRNEC